MASTLTAPCVASAAAARGAAVPSTSAPGSQLRRQPLGSARCRRRSSSSSPSVVAAASASDAKSVTLLDYGAGNVRSVSNAIKTLGYELKEARREFQEGERKRKQGSKLARIQSRGPSPPPSISKKK